jgi:hypothetical protein
LLHGGSEDDSGHIGFGDCWLFRDCKWEQMPKSYDTEHRDDHGLAYHHEARRLVMTNGIVGDGETLLRDEHGWQVAETSYLPQLQCSPLVWDETLGGLVQYGGETHHGGRQFAKTWVLRLQ